MLTKTDIYHRICTSGSIKLDFKIEEFSYYEESQIYTFLCTLKEMGLIESYNVALGKERSEMSLIFLRDPLGKYDRMYFKKVDLLIDSVSMS